MAIKHYKLMRWHVWLGWLIGVPIILWTASGLLMVVKPIEQVRGNHLRIEQEELPLPASNSAPVVFQLENAKPVQEIRLAMQRGRPVTFLTYIDDKTERFDGLTGAPIGAVDKAELGEIVAAEIIGGDKITSLRFFEADKTPFDFRRALPVWQAKLADGTHVYVGRDTGEIEAVRTQFWRAFDFMWGIHIMDLQTREDTSHPILIFFAAISLIGSILGFFMLFTRRRRARSKAV